jgi:hypothetical protein
VHLLAVMMQRPELSLITPYPVLGDHGLMFLMPTIQDIRYAFHFFLILTLLSPQFPVSASEQSQDKHYGNH